MGLVHSQPSVPTAGAQPVGVASIAVSRTADPILDIVPGPHVGHAPLLLLAPDLFAARPLPGGAIGPEPEERNAGGGQDNPDPAAPEPSGNARYHAAPTAFSRAQAASPMPAMVSATNSNRTVDE